MCALCVLVYDLCAIFVWILCRYVVCMLCTHVCLLCYDTLCYVCEFCCVNDMYVCYVSIHDMSVRMFGVYVIAI